MNKPEITLITLDYPPERGGVARYLGNLVNVAQGRIEVLVPENHAVDGPGEVRTIRMFRKVWPSWWPTVSLMRKSKKEKRVIFISHVFPLGTAAWLSRLSGGPEYVVFFHGLDIKLAATGWKKWLLRRICRNAKALFTNSEATKAELMKVVGEIEVTVMTPGAEPREIVDRATARRRLGVDSETPIVLSLTRLVPRKGIDASLHALARIQAKQEVDYVVIGDGPDRERLEKLAVEHRTKVRWIKDADDEEKWLWYAAADVFLLPVREEENDMEGFGIVYLEAAQAGIPAIAGRSGGAGEAVRDGYTGLLVKPISIDEIEEAVMRLLDDRDLAHRLGTQGRERVSKDFSWKDRWETLYARCRQ
ncbi:MAG: glycosyltransferase family 4 protein [Patescibacteria group bacterium]|nr:glycosyltransferase family 4 protein [Patescibacteria group bacterium]